MSAPTTSTDELREEVERLRLLHSIGLELGGSLDFDELLPKVFNRVLTALGAEGGSIWIADGDMLRTQLAILRRLAKHELFNTIELRQQIAQKIIERGKYTLG